MGKQGSFSRWIFLTLLGVALALPLWAGAAMIGTPAPELTNEVWINSRPLRLADLRGKVILLEFWTHG
ncbi:MAG: hypothetical protein L0191_03260 [Acidobacteria bacterium]|nr:hypothetical protein [Acidobacteriota bacterium]